MARIVFLAYLLLPFLASLAPEGHSGRSVFAKGALASAARILFLLALARLTIVAEGTVSISGTLVNGYPLGFVLTLDGYRYGFLLIAEFCFLLAHWMSPNNVPHAQMVRTLICLAQGFCSLFVVSDNSVATGALQFLSGAVFFYLVRFAISDDDEASGAFISSRLYILYSMLGLLMIAWGIAEFSNRDLILARGSGSKFGLLCWLGLVILAVPLPPFSRWFNLSVERLPEGVTLTLVTFLSAVALKFATLFRVVYPDLSWRQELLIYSLGLMGCAFSIGGLFAAKSRRRMLGSLPSFFFSMLLVAVGVSKTNLVLSAYFVCLFVPVFSSLVLYASMMEVRNPMQKIFVGLLFALCAGMPGTPVYQIFSGIGARSLDMGVGYTIAFGLIWFFYFCANAHLCRRIFLDDKPPVAAVGTPQMHADSLLFAGYGIFLMCLIIAVTQLAGRIL